MKKKILISILLDEYRIAVMEDGVLVEFYIERPDLVKRVGNIYRGKILSINPELNAAFVDIGVERSAFLPLSREREDILKGEEIFEEQLEVRKLSKDDEILVQVTKEGVGTKGARLTQYCSLPGRYLVLMTGTKHIGVSRKIVNLREKYRLKKIVKEIQPPNFGVIVRTVAQGVEMGELKRDIEILLKMWRRLERIAGNKTAPVLLYKETDFITAFVRDNLAPDTDSIIMDSKKAYKQVLNYVKKFAPNYHSRIKLHDSPIPLFDVYKVNDWLKKSFRRKIKLPSGGYIVIEETEALVAVDVNSGSFKGRGDAEVMSLTTNLEAAKEVARQVRLRDKGGVIVIDFIDMQEASNKRKVMNTLKKELKKDKSKTRIYGMSKLGLVQFTRKRSRLSLTQILFDYCPVCEGTGHIPSIQDIASRLEQHLLSLPRRKHMRVGAKGYIISYLKTAEWIKLRKIMRMNRIQVDFEPDPNLNYGELILTDVDTGKQYNVGR